MRATWMSIFFTVLPAAAQDGSLWVGLENTAELVRLDPQGAQTTTVSVPMPSASLALDGRGQAWALDAEEGRLIHLAPNGGLLGVHATSRRPTALVVDGQERAWVLSGRDGNLVAFSSQGLIERAIAVPHGSTDVALDAFSRFHVADPGHASLLTYDMDGRLLRRVRGLPGVRNVTVSHFGEVFATNPRRGRIHRIPEGQDVPELLVDLPGRITPPVVDGNGRLWFALTRHDLLVRVDRTGTGILWFPTAEAPRSLALGVDGDVWVACEKNPCLQRFANSGILRASFPLSAIPNLAGDPAGAHFLSQARPLDDRDGDGYSNRNEWVAATNPVSARSVPAWIDVQGGAGTWAIEFGVTNPSPSYYVAYLTSMTSPGTLLASLDGADLRTVPTTVIDPIFLASGQLPSMLQPARGRLNGLGRASATVSLPPELRGLGIAFAFVTIDRDSSSSPNALRVISRAVPLVD